MKTYDCLIVFGAAVWPNEQPSPTLVRRASHAASLLKSGVSKNIIGSGGLGNNPPSEALAIMRICESEGVDSSQIHLEDQSTTSAENIAFSIKMMKNLGFQNAGLVTDFYHMPRVYLCCRMCGIDVGTYVAHHDKFKTKPWKTAYYLFRELVALPVYIWRFRSIKK